MERSHAKLLQLKKQREILYAGLPKALRDNIDDPLAAYDNIFQWTLKTYGQDDADSGLEDLLKRATDAFKEDVLYKTDLRYLRMWLTYASMSTRADALAMYTFLVENGIGVTYSMLYEGYAHLLEKDGRHADAEAIYRKGIRAQPRALDRLKQAYKGFKARRANTPGQQPAPAAPLPAVAQADMPLVTSSTISSRYATMLAPVPPGKRREVLKFDLNLLFTADGVEYCNHEARARSMGLLGKKWGPPPVSSHKLSVSSVNVDFNDDGHRATTNMTSRRKSWMVGGGAEPTVTINTKEALADVFGMYNSPEKTMKLAPGSKHVPLRTVAPLTPALRQEQITKTPTLSFRPQVDENAGTGRKTPAAKFRSFSDAESSNDQTPRGIVFQKDPSIDEPENSRSRREASTEDFGRVTPSHVSLHQRAQSHDIPPSVFRPASAAKSSNNTSDDASSSSLPDENAARTPFRVFSRPPAGEGSSAVTPRAFTPFVDAPPIAGTFTPFAESKLASAFTPFKDPSAAPAAQTFTPFQDVAKPTPAFTPFRDVAPAFTPFKDTGSAPAFTPFKDAAQPMPAFTPFKDASQPMPAFTPFRDPAQPTPAFTPFKDVTPSFPEPQAAPAPPAFIPLKEKAAFVPFLDEVPLSEKKATASHHDAHDAPTPFAPSASTSSTSSWTPEGEDEEQYQDEYEYDDQEEIIQIGDEEEEDGSFREQEMELNDIGQEVDGSFPLGDRWGAFSTMTPIAERTFEYTGQGSSFNVDTPSGVHDRSVSAVQQLADGADDEDEQQGPLEPFRIEPDLSIYEEEESSILAVVEMKTGALSLADAMTASSNFHPSNPCNPFDPKIMSTVLSLIPSDDEFHDVRPHTADQIGALQKFAKKARKTSGNSNAGHTGVLDSAAHSFPLALGERRLNVSDKLGEGGFGLVFKAVERKRESDDSDEEDDFDEDDEDEASVVAVKVVKPGNIWEYHALRRLHSTLPISLRRSVVRPHALYAFADESYLLLDMCPQGTLLGVVNNAVSSGASQPGGLLDELLVMFFAIELLRVLEGMHATGFIHGDLKIDNCLLRLEDVPSGVEWDSRYQASGEGGWSCKGVKLIDFGRAVDTRLFPDHQEYVADWAAEEHDCPEIRHSKPWTYHTDYFGLAGIVYCMLFGLHIKTDSIVVVDGRSKIATPLKRYWQKELWTQLFDILLNPTLDASGARRQLPLVEELGSVRRDMEGWLQDNCDRGGNTLKRLLKKVELHVWQTRS